MKKLSHAMAVALLAVFVPVPAMAATSVQDQVVSSASKITYALTPGSDAYKGWTA
jgi:hypothetical protein